MQKHLMVFLKLAEKIHQIWLSKSKDRRLVIVRPSVIYGPHDPGNIYRTIKALKKVCLCCLMEVILLKPMVMFLD